MVGEEGRLLPGGAVSCSLAPLHCLSTRWNLGCWGHGRTSIIAGRWQPLLRADRYKGGEAECARLAPVLAAVELEEPTPARIPLNPMVSRTAEVSLKCPRALGSWRLRADRYRSVLFCRNVYVSADAPPGG